MGITCRFYICKSNQKINNPRTTLGILGILSSDAHEVRNPQVINKVKMSNFKCINKYGSDQIVNIMKLVQENCADASDELVEQIFTEVMDVNKMPKIVLEKWKKSKRDIIKAAKQAKKDAKDPNYPKCPISAYIRFSMSGVRNSIKTKNPELKPKEIMTELGLKWKAMTEVEKKPFLESYEKDHVKYLELKKVYELEHPKSVKRVKRTEPDEVEFTDKEKKVFDKYQEKYSYFPFDQKLEGTEKKELKKQKKEFTEYFMNKHDNASDSKAEKMKTFIDKCSKLYKL